VLAEFVGINLVAQTVDLLTVPRAGEPDDEAVWFGNVVHG